MADKGPIVRVNTERDIIIKMTEKKAKEFVATHPGAKIVPTPASREVATTFAEPDQAPEPIAPASEKPPAPATPKSTASKS